MPASYAESYHEIQSSLTELVTIGGIALLIAALVIALIVILVLHYIEAIPTFIIAKKNGFRFAWIALLPLPFCTAFVLSSTPGTRDVSLIGKWSVKNTVAFILFIFVSILGVSIMNVVAKSLILIPILGFLLSAITRIIPVAAIVLFEYAFLRDVIDIYSTDKKSNAIIAVVIAVANRFIPIVKGIYLWTLVGKTPAEQPITAEFTEE